MYKHSNIKHKLLRSTAYISVYASSYINKCFGEPVGKHRCQISFPGGVHQSLWHSAKYGAFYLQNLQLCSTSNIHLNLFINILQNTHHQTFQTTPCLGYKTHLPNLDQMKPSQQKIIPKGALLIYHHVKIGQLRFIKPIILRLATAETDF